jgi:hypothetical protein
MLCCCCCCCCCCGGVDTIHPLFLYGSNQSITVGGSIDAIVGLGCGGFFLFDCSTKIHTYIYAYQVRLFVCFPMDGRTDKKETRRTPNWLGHLYVVQSLDWFESKSQSGVTWNQNIRQTLHVHESYRGETEIRRKVSASSYSTTTTCPP